MAGIYRLVLGFSFFLSVVGPAAVANADALIIDPFICAAVEPCGTDGYLLPQFSDSSSPCFEIYQSRCAEVSGKEEIFNQYLYALVSENSALHQENERLRKAIRRMRSSTRSRN